MSTQSENVLATVDIIDGSGLIDWVWHFGRNRDRHAKVEFKLDRSVIISADGLAIAVIANEDPASVEAMIRINPCISYLERVGDSGEEWKFAGTTLLHVATWPPNGLFVKIEGEYSTRTRKGQVRFLKE